MERNFIFWTEREAKMSLEKPLLFDTINEEETETSRTYQIDWEKGRIRGFMDGAEAMKQFIKKALLTPRFQCLIYDTQYGSELQETFRNPNISREYLETELPFLIEDALIYDGRILKVSNMEIAFGETYPMKDSVAITFEVDTIFGKIPVKEVYHV